MINLEPLGSIGLWHYKCIPQLWSCTPHHTCLNSAAAVAATGKDTKHWWPHLGSHKPQHKAASAWSHQCQRAVARLSEAVHCDVAFSGGSAFCCSQADQVNICLPGCASVHDTPQVNLMRVTACMQTLSLVHACATCNVASMPPTYATRS